MMPTHTSPQHRRLVAAKQPARPWRHVCLVLLAALSTWNLQAAPARPPAEQAASTGRSVLAVEIVRPRQTTVNRGLPASGNVAAALEASVSPKIGGLRIARIVAQVGSRVKRGDVMLEFDDDTLRAELSQLEATVAEAEIAAAEAQRGAERARKVGENGAMSTQQIEQMLAADATARARVKALGESVNLQQLRLKQATLLAPDDGIVSHRAATLGAVVPAGMELFRIIRGGRLEWRAEVSANDMSRLSSGTVARVALEDGTTLQGTVRLVAPTVDPVTRQGIVFVDLPPAHALRAGMFVRGELLLGGSQAWVLPQSAVMVRDGFHMVARIGADRRVSFAKVGIGKRQGALVEITEGLSADTDVVAQGAALLSEGDQVRVVGAKP